jgi:hypothetical protein
MVGFYLSRVAPCSNDNENGVMFCAVGLLRGIVSRQTGRALPDWLFFALNVFLC